ncbi:bacterial extracellular solute-binding s, 3 family protein, partial [Vibrio parahaemolyticus AQ3810]
RSGKTMANGHHSRN